jgi:YidC/Oxa1 family membrane protein insertase
MDRKGITVVVLCAIGLVAWMYWMPKLYPPAPVTQTSAATNTIAAGTKAAPAQSAGTNPAVTLASSNHAPRFIAETNVPEQLLMLTNDNARYTFTSRGGGLKDVQLLHYPETVATRRNKKRDTGELATLNDGPVAPVLSMIGDEALQGDGVFKLTPILNGVRAEKSLAGGLTLVKEFTLSTNYLVATTMRWENASKQPVSIPAHDWVVGTATPMGLQDNGMAEMVMWYNGAKPGGQIALTYFSTNTTTLFVFSRTPLTEYQAGETNVFWASAQNQFFTLTAITGTNTPAEYLTVHAVDLPKPTKEEIALIPGTVLNPRGMQVAMHYPGQTIAPGQSSELHFNLFAGPKEYETLARLDVRFNNDIELVMNFGFFGAISKGLLITMNWLYHNVVPSYGWIIVIITVVIKMIFWPVTRASTRSMKRMQALQPQLKALQEKYKDDPAKFSQKQWEFFKKNKVNPLGGCLPMLLQIPVFFGLLSMLRNAIELRGAHFLWMSDLSQPDTIALIPFLGRNVPLNLMPILMGASQFWLMRMTPPSPGMDPAQQKIMRYMPLLFVYFLYSYSSGLALYWMVSNLLSVLQTKITRTDPPPAAAVAPATAGPPKKRN